MYQICVSAAARGESVEQGKEIARHVGELLARAGHGLLTGATLGLPHEASVAYKKAKGVMSLGLSPATSKVEHVAKYHLPTDSYDAILYTGMHYVGRDVLLVNSADAIISIGGRIGTLHEFTIAYETKTPIGFVLGAGGVSDEINDIIHAAGKRNTDLVVMGKTPEEVLKKLVAILDQKTKKYHKLYL